MAKYCYILSLMLISLSSVAQVDTTVTMDQVVISSSIRQQLPGSVSVDLSQDETASDLTNQLLLQSNTYLRQYGPGSLATPSIRGGNAAHTLVLWNGLPLQSPMLGLLDLSLVAANTGESLTLQKGGSTALWGSGAVAGLISIDSKEADSSGLYTVNTIGSFGSKAQRTKVNLRSGRLSSTTKYSHESADRDFFFARAPGLAEEQQTNGHYSRNHLMQDIYYQLHPKHELSAHLWAYTASTQIPPTTTQTVSTAYQEDAALRGILGWKYTGKNSVTNAKVGYYIDDNSYFEPATALEAVNRYNTLYIDGSHQVQIKKNQSLLLGATYSHTEATSPGYRFVEDEKRIAFFVAHKLATSRWQMHTALRQERVDGALLPVIPTLGVQYQAAPWLSIRGKVSKDYRLPTLNDRYWNPGGNTELLPEEGWSREVGADLSFSGRAFSYTTKLTAYRRDIANWILWTPDELRPFWSANNVNEVRSQGLEVQMTWSYKQSWGGISLVQNLDLTSSRYQQALSLPRVQPGDQLIYTPTHQASHRLAIQIYSWTASANLRQVGSVTAVNGLLPAYTVLDTRLQYDYQIGDYGGAIVAEVLNTGDSDYFIIERRPLPGRNYRLTITLNLVQQDTDQTINTNI